MSGIELLAVVGCVAAVSSAYCDGRKLVKDLRRRRASQSPVSQDSQDALGEALENALDKANTMIRTQYDCGVQQMGNNFAIGDQNARNQLKDIVIHLQNQIVTKLTFALLENTAVDYRTVLEAANDSKDRTVICLLQLHQRLLLAPSTLNTNLAQREGIQTTQDSPDRTETYYNAQEHSRVRNGSPIANETIMAFSLPSYPLPLPEPVPVVFADRPATPNSITGRSSPSKFGFLRKHKPSEEQLPSARYIPALTDKSHTPPYSDAVERFTPNPDHGTMLDSGIGSPSTDHNLFEQSPRIDLNLWNELPAINSSASSHCTSLSASTARSSSSATSAHRHLRSSPPMPSSMPDLPLPSLNGAIMPPKKVLPIVPGAKQRQFLPNESNKYQGLCKSAWRLQTGQTKGAMKALTRLVSASGMQSERIWSCTKCAFEGRVVMVDKEARVDRAVHEVKVTSPEGEIFTIRWRWSFLFKSHFHHKRDPNAAFMTASERNQHGALPMAIMKTARFGCAFCCALGKGMPELTGVLALLEHLAGHHMGEGRWPEDEVLYRMGCIVGERALNYAAWDLNLVAS